MYHKRLNWLWFFVQGEKRPGLHHMQKIIFHNVEKFYFML
ncbi:unnamed protein product [Tenebrio molitor]|nr:unnamed protein product [Tenebrio molitor]